MVFFRVFLSFTGFYWVLLGFTGFYWVLPSFTEFIKDLMVYFWNFLEFRTPFHEDETQFKNSIRFDWGVLVLDRFYWVFHGFTDFWPSFTEFNEVLLGFDEFPYVLTFLFH